MIPYFAWKVIPLGPVAIQVWGLCAAAGVLLGVWFGLHLAKKRGLDVAAFESMAFWIVIAAFAGARLLHVLAYEPAYYFAHPSQILSIWKGGLSSFGGFIGAGLAAAWQIRKHKLPFLRTADVAIPAVALGLGCGRVGCFLIHDHPGTLAHGAGTWFAVRYANGPYYDLGLLLCLFDFLMFGAFLILMKKSRRDGFYFALFMTVYGPVRFLLDFLRILDVRYFGLTPGQYGSIALFAAGLWLMYRIHRRPEAA